GLFEEVPGDRSGSKRQRRGRWSRCAAWAGFGVARGGLIGTPRLQIGNYKASTGIDGGFFIWPKRFDSAAMLGLERPPADTTGLYRVPDSDGSRVVCADVPFAREDGEVERHFGFDDHDAVSRRGLADAGDEVEHFCFALRIESVRRAAKYEPGLVCGG